MAELLVDGDDLVVHLPTRQKMLSAHGDIRVPLSAVTSVTPVGKPWLALRGWRMAGTALRGSIAAGTWRHGSGYDFCMVRRMRPAIEVEVATGRFERILISVDDGVDHVTEANRVADAAGIAHRDPRD